MTSENAYYHAIVDMGSNGIRFSITDVGPDRARILNVVYQSRVGISLYDAQWEMGEAVSIAPNIIDQVTGSLVSFRRTCRSFGVPDKNIRIVATEATRTAKNSVQFRDEIKRKAGLEVEIYPKEVEGLVGAYGVASSFDEVKGLVMDLGGGSTQITWINFPDESHPEKINMCDKYSVSMPYGAAALSRRLDEAKRAGPDALKALRDEVTDNMERAVKAIDIPRELFYDHAVQNQLTLYLSGGGFRGWGYVLMDQHRVQPYPIPLINGFRVSASNFYDTSAITTAVKTAGLDASKIFRVSSRRASQIPAVAFLVSCLLDTLPAIRAVYFCQGGVREGTLFRTLSPSVRAQDPFQSATAPHALLTLNHDALLARLRSAIPHNMTAHRTKTTNDSDPPNNPLSPGLLAGLVNLMYVHASNPVDIRAAAALRSTTTGILASAHGLSHQRRAALALALCESHGGYSDLSASDRGFYEALMQVLSEGDLNTRDNVPMAWWCVYLGRVAGLLRILYPAGMVDEGEGNVMIRAVVRMADDWRMQIVTNRLTKTERPERDGTKEGKTKVGTLIFGISLEDSKSNLTAGFMPASEEFEKALNTVEKAGKKKSWVGFDVGLDIQIEVSGALKLTI